MTRRPLAVMRLASLLLVALVLGATSAAHGQSYPSRPVRIIVPYPPGGSSDIAARTIAAALAQGAQQPFIIDNRPGAGGIIGLQAAQAAAADGHTLLATPAVLLSMVESQRAGGTSVPAGLETLVPIAQLGVDSQVLVVGAHRPWRSARELLEAARAAPGKLSYASSGQGSTSHLAMQALVLANALEMTHIPYKGMADATAGLTGGHVDAAVVSAPGIVSHVQAGRLRALAVVGTARSPVLGDVPTIADVGISAAVVPSWIGLFAPAGTPAAVQTRLHELIVTALRDPTAVASLERLMLRIEPRTGDDFRRIVARDMRIVSALARGVAPAASDLARATPAPSPAVAAAPPVAP
ncbi:MAG: tripartite tricarboxylate transporter substrate binding protein, partial [Candidatus Rokubacteria bacterium]|nr:tripartite tricarboxylate transporter substrate binding protein [Candidatus Rokubacteria bacterium]